MFITLEGGEGSGKSTVAKGLKSYFEAQGRDVLVTREPGGSALAEDIRKLIFNYDIDAETEMLLFAAARRNHLKTIIEPALKNNKIVICDRFIDSSRVYQGHKSLYQKVEDINTIAIDSDNIIDLTFLLDVDPEIGLKRISDNNRETNRFDKKSIDFHNNIRHTYLQLQKDNPQRIKYINANNKPEHILDKCIKYIEIYSLKNGVNS